MVKNSETNWIEGFKSYTKCPKCKTGSLDTRVPRGFFVKHFLGMGLKRYKCNNCGAKVYLKAGQQDKK